LGSGGLTASFFPLICVAYVREPRVILLPPMYWSGRTRWGGGSIEAQTGWAGQTEGPLLQPNFSRPTPQPG